MRAFEIHTFKDGQWKVDSVFDDRDLALHEAKKVDENGRYTSIRVIEENYDEVSDLTTTRTIFRGKGDPSTAKAPIPKKRSAVRNTSRSSRERQPGGNAPRRSSRKKKTSLVGPVIFLFLLIIGGVAVMFGLQYVEGLK